MADLPHSRLTPLQRELLDGFFAREQRFFLETFRKALIQRLREEAWAQVAHRTGH